jgi:hypothetical protein
MSQSTSMIESIRHRPGLYLGSKSLTAFYHFLNGYKIACSAHRIEEDLLGLEIPHDFHEWVAYRTRFRESTSGWCNMIVATSRSEEEAFDRFFELLKEHSARVPRLVAEILHPETTAIRMELDGKDYRIPPPPRRVRIVTYTDDPGFFALHDCEEWPDRFYPCPSRMVGLSGGEWVIHDEEAFREMQQASEEWERELNESMR